MNNNLENYRESVFVDFCTSELSTYVSDYHGVETALIATSDGFEIASYSHNLNYAGDKLAAVSSSLFALGVSLVNEFDLNDCNSIILDSSDGKVFMSSVSSGEHSLVLMIQTNSQATLGNIIHGSKKLNKLLSNKLSTL